MGLWNILYDHFPRSGKNDFRGWEWYYLRALCDRSQLTLGGNVGDGRLVAHDQYNRMFVSGADGDTVAISDWEELGGTSWPGVRSVAWSPDGRYVTSTRYNLSTGSHSYGIVIWDWREKKPVRELYGHEDEVCSVAWSPDGRRLASASNNGTIKIWEWANGKSDFTLATRLRQLNAVAWSPDGKRLVSGDALTVQIWKVEEGAEPYRLYCANLGPALSVAWSPDGQWLAAGHEKREDGNNKVSLWKVDNWEHRVLRDSQGHGSINSVAWSPDSRFIACGTDHLRIKVWDVTTGKKQAVLRDHKNKVNSVAWNLDGTKLVSTGEDHTIKIWDWPNKEVLTTLCGYRGPVYSAIWSPDGRYIVSGGMAGTKIWDASRTDEALICRYDNWISSVAWSPDGKRIATAYLSPNVKVWDPATGETILTLNGHKQRVWDVAWSPDGKRIATASEDNTAKVWDTSDGRELMTLTGHQSPVKSVKFALDGLRIITGSEDRSIRVWDSQTGEEIFKIPGYSANSVHSLVISPDGLRAASTCIGGTKVWDTKTTMVIGTFAVTTKDNRRIKIESLAWSPDGQKLAASTDIGRIAIWDVASGCQLSIVQAHTGAARSVAWSPDCKRIVSGGDDGTLKIRDVTTGEEVLVLQGHTAQVSSVVWDPDGWRLASGSYDNTVKVWDASIPYEIESRISRKPTTTGPSDKTKKQDLDWLKVVSIKPESPNLLKLGDRVEVTVKYRLASTDKASLRVSPLMAGRHVQGYRPDLPPEFQKGRGELTVGFALDRPIVVDELLVSMGQLIEEKRLWSTFTSVSVPANLRWVASLKPMTMREEYVRSRCEREVRNIEKTAQKMPGLASLKAVTLTKLGKEQYEDRAYREVLIALEYADKIRGTIGLNPQCAESFAETLALKTMAYYRLGSHDQAYVVFGSLLDLFSGPKLAQLDRGYLFVQNEEEHLFEAAKVLSEGNEVLRSVWKAIEIKDLGKVAQLLEALQAQLDRKINKTHDLAKAVANALASVYYQRSRAAGCDNGLYVAPANLLGTALEFDPNYVPALNDLAWLLATCIRAELRDGTESVKLAKRACELTGWRDCQCIDTLAAGYAELGDYDRAVECQKKAITLLLPGVQRSFHDRSTSQRSYEMRLKQYESRKTYHESLVAQWTFEKITDSGQLADVSGNDLRGDIVGDACIVEDPEKGKVLRLDGNGDYIDCGNSGQFDITREITVSAWIKVDSFDKDWQTIIGKGDSWWLKRYGGTNTVGFSYRYWERERKGGVRFTQKLSRNVNDGKWHQIVAVRDLAYLQMYLDGNLNCISPCNSKDITVNNGSLLIGGCFVRHPEQEWNGLIDDVRIYNYSLTEADVRDLYELNSSSDSQKKLDRYPKGQARKNASVDKQNAFQADFTPWMNGNITNNLLISYVENY